MLQYNGNMFKYNIAKAFNCEASIIIIKKT